MRIKVFHIDGEFVELRKFRGLPAIGDVLIVGEHLMEVKSRRWTASGSLEIVVDEY